MPRRLYEISFIGAALVLVALVGTVNCLQGTPFVGALKCSYTYTSADLLVKVLGSLIFILFLGLILGPIAATIIRVPAKKERKQTKP